MNLVGSLQTLADYALKSAEGETLAIYDSIAHLSHTLCAGVSKNHAERPALKVIAAKAALTAKTIRDAEECQLAFQELLGGGES